MTTQTLHQELAEVEREIATRWHEVYWDGFSPLRQSVYSELAALRRRENGLRVRLSAAESEETRP